MEAEMAEEGKQNQNRGGDPLDSGKGKDPEGTFESFEAFLEKQPDAVKELYNAHTTGLKNSVSAARKERDDLSRQVKELLKGAEKGSDLERQLTEFQAKLDSAEKRANFAEAAILPEIGCTNVKAAFLIAQADELFKRDGSPDWEAIKRAAPELFKKAGQAGGSAGAGTSNSAPKEDMNSIIRKMAGRG